MSRPETRRLTVSQFRIIPYWIIHSHYHLRSLSPKPRSRSSEEASAITPPGRGARSRRPVAVLSRVRFQRYFWRSLRRHRTLPSAAGQFPLDGSVCLWLQSRSPRRRSRAAAAGRRTPCVLMVKIRRRTRKAVAEIAGLACSWPMPAGVFGPRSIAMCRRPKFTSGVPNLNHCAECVLRVRLRRKLVERLGDGSYRVKPADRCPSLFCVYRSHDADPAAR